MSNFFFDQDVLFDSHCHLNDHSFDADKDEVIKRAVEAGVEKIVDVAIDIACSEKAIATGHKYPGAVYATVGIDPDLLIPGSQLFDENLAKDESVWDDEIDTLRKLAKENPNIVVAIGESGIDAYWQQRSQDPRLSDKSWVEEVMQKQEMLFRKHLELATELKLPLTIHSRAAEQRCLEIVRDYPDASGVFHSYTGDYETAKGILDAGWGLGVNGIITFKNANELRELYRKILGDIKPDMQPADFYTKGIYFETDSPYLSPEGKRGERNEPGYLKIVLNTLTKSDASVSR